MIPLTPKQQALLDFIKAYILGHGYSPLQTEMAAHMGYRFGTQTRDGLAGLERAGAIRRTPGKHRGVVVL